MPLDYYNTYVDKLSKVSVPEVMAAAARQLHPGQAVYVVVGNGAEKVIARASDDKPGARSGKDVPYLKDGAQLTLREALADLAARGDVGGGGLIELDTDGHVK
ncbi:MAG: hypothetical protein E6J90_25280 [Deltaproteobacteria bacterium]|nr:MAG: hypothetical protein E6J90_25280 [Deltaproteobacteria bacterium]